MRRKESKYISLDTTEDRSDVLQALATNPSTTSDLDGSLVTVRSDSNAFILDAPLEKAKRSGRVSVHFNVHNATFHASGEVQRRGRNQIELTHIQVSSANRRDQPRLPLTGLASMGVLGTPGRVINGGPWGLQVSMPLQTKVRSGVHSAIRIKLPSAVLNGHAQVRNVRHARDQIIGGLELEPQGDASAFAAWMLQAAYPAMRPRCRVDRETVTTLLKAGGYLKLTSTPIPDEWYNFSSRNSFDFVYQAKDGVGVAHVSVTRAYSSAWIFHQLTGRPDHADSFQSRYTMYRILSQAPTMLDGPRAHAIAYFDPTLAWHQHYVFNFLRWMGQTEHAEVTRADRFELESQGSTGGPLTQIQVSLMTDSQRELCHAIARSNWSPLLARAMDIEPRALRTNDLLPVIDTEFKRRREVFVAHHNGEIRAVAIAEFGSSNSSIFGMFNIAHILTKDGRPLPPAEAHDLIESVRQWYRRNNVASAIIAAPEGVLTQQSHPAATFVETMGRFVLDGPGLRHY
ncbi:MAG: hypothetical protein AAF449_24825, partial [Myxococcota bacterium]